MSEKNFLNSADVSEYMGISISLSYKIIRKLNDELKNLQLYAGYQRRQEII